MSDVQPRLPDKCPYCFCPEYADHTTAGIGTSRHFACGISLPALDDHKPSATDEIWREHVPIIKEIALNEF